MDSKYFLYAGILVAAIIFTWAILPLFLFDPCCDGLIDPSDKTLELLNDQYNKPGVIRTTMPVMFTPNMILSSAALSWNKSFSANNLCMSLGEFEEDEEDGFSIISTEPHHKLAWNGQSNQLVKIMVTCNINREKLMDTIEGTRFEKWSPDCGICEGQGRCCLVALVKD
jgi:hypothetical protein